MSLEQFITDLLNVKSNDIQEIYHLKQSDESLIIKVKLKRNCFLVHTVEKKKNSTSTVIILASSSIPLLPTESVPFTICNDATNVRTVK